MNIERATADGLYRLLLDVQDQLNDLDNGVVLHDLQDSLGQADPRTTRRHDRSRHKLAKSAGYDVARALQYIQLSRVST